MSTNNCYAAQAKRPDAVRGEMTLRMLVLIGLLSPLRHGATLSELTADVSLENGQVCERTIRRDLQILVDLGLVTAVTGEYYRIRWIWRREPPAERLAVAAEQFAEIDPPRPIARTNRFLLSSIGGQVLPKGIA
jgi:hypothetical protein